MDGRRASYASVDSSHSSGSYHSTGMRRSPSLPLKPSSIRSSPNVSEMRGSRRVVSVVDQQAVMAPEHVTDHMTGHVNNHETSPRKTPEHVSKHRRHSTSDSQGRTRRRHQYDHVRAPHPYEDMGVSPPMYPTPATPSQSSQASQEEKPITSPNTKHWKQKFLKRDNRPKSSPAPKRSLNASDSKLSRFSRKGSTNSPAPGKRFSAGNVLEESLVGVNQTPGSKHRRSSPESQLHTQMLNRYFPTEVKMAHEANGDVKEQVCMFSVFCYTHSIPVGEGV